MVVNFMQNLSSAITVSKTVSSTKPIDCALKGNCNVMKPSLVVVGENISAYNYFQIPEFGNRYYYISEIITRNENTFEVSGEVDVLMSFSTAIRNADAVIDRNENQYIKYIQDSQYTVLSYERIQTKKFPNSFPNNGEFVLVVAGS